MIQVTKENRLEEIAHDVMNRCPRPEIFGRGHAPRIKAPRNRAVWRILAYADVAGRSGSSCGYTAVSLAREVADRAAKEGIIFDFDGSFEKEQFWVDVEERNKRIRAAIEKRDADYKRLGGWKACMEWFFALTPFCQKEILRGRTDPVSNKGRMLAIDAWLNKVSVKLPE